MTFEIQEWEIWHTYTTYVDSTRLDLRETAIRLATAGITECAVSSDGFTVWLSKGVVTTGYTEIKSGPFDSTLKFELILDDETSGSPSDFALEAWGQSAYFLANERRVLAQDSELLPHHVRAFLGKFLLISKSPERELTELSVYPILNIYESGVLILEFRVIGSNTPTSLTKFIDGAVNLFVQQFDSVLVSPAFSAFATRAYHQSNCQLGFLGRIQLMRSQVQHELALKQRTERHVDDSFEFDLAPLSGSQDNLSAIAMTIFNVMAFIAGCPRTGLSFALLGQRPALQIGKFWSGRPHIHLVRFRDQRRTVSENEKVHGPDLGRIVSRAATLDDIVAVVSLPKNARSFQDYAAYITSSASLWVWSLQGLSEQDAWMDPNRGNLIYGRQVLVELLEYGYMLHRSLYHRLETLSSTSKVVAVRKEILLLRNNMREASHSGEVRKLLEYGWNELGLAGLMPDIEEGLRVREFETNVADARRTARIGWALTTIFGFVAVPALADQVIQPLWKLTSIRQFSNSALTAIVSDAISLAVVLVFVLLVLFVISSPEK